MREDETGRRNELVYSILSYTWPCSTLFLPGNGGNFSNRPKFRITGNHRSIDRFAIDDLWNSSTGVGLPEREKRLWGVLNIVRGKFCITIRKTWTFKGIELITWKLSMREDLTAFVREFWRYFKTLTSWVGKLCIWEALKVGENLAHKTV
jgi:hypothetical protein